jgi:hypothetical protein
MICDYPDNVKREMRGCKVCEEMHGTRQSWNGLLFEDDFVPELDIGEFEVGFLRPFVELAKIRLANIQH